MLPQSFSTRPRRAAEIATTASEIICESSRRFRGC